MKIDAKWQWLAVYLGPAIFVAIPTAGIGPFMLVLGGVVGVLTGLTSEAPYFTLGFKLLLGATCLICVAMFAIGIKFKVNFWGKALSAGGVYLWCIAGLIGFGPQ